MNNYNNSYQNESLSFGRVLKQDLQSPIGAFILKSFGLASLYLLLFGVIVLLISWQITLNSSKFFSGKGVYYYLIPFFVLSILSMFLRSWWARNVANASSALVLGVYIIRFVLYLFLFVPLIAFLNLYDSSQISNFSSQTVFLNSLKYVAIGFGGSVVTYFFPAFIGFILKNAKVARSLMFAIAIASFLSFGLIIVYLITSFTTGWFGLSSFAIIINVLFAVIAFLSPIITIYQMKRTAAYIDFEEKQIGRRWINFFAFEILGEMMFIAYLIIRFIGVSRLR